MRTQRQNVLRKTHPPAFKIGLKHCRQTIIPVWSLWLTISQNRMQTNVFGSESRYCETGWKLVWQDEKPEIKARIWIVPVDANYRAYRSHRQRRLAHLNQRE